MSEPIRVAQVMGKMIGGGLESVVMNYYRHIDRSKVQFDFIIDEDSTLIPHDEIELLGGRIFIVPPYQHVFAYQKALVKLFREQKWRIVHSHENALSVFPLRAAKRAGVPVRIAHSHSTSGTGEPVRNIIKWLLRRFANVYPTYRMACSQQAGEWLFGKKHDFTILYNAIELSQFDFDIHTRDNVRATLGISNKTLVVGHIGRFVTQKNHLFLIDVFNQVVQNGKDALLILVGDGPLYATVKRKVEDLNIADKVLFLGQRNDVNRLYQAFDVFCLPSLYEGLGIVAVEAQAAGLQCILSNRITREVDVTREIEFEDINNKHIWADTVCRVEPGYRNEICKQNFGNYDIEKATTRLEQIYQQLLKLEGRD